MRSLYSAPFRVYLFLILAACFGIWMGVGLPVSLFPNSSKPHVHVDLNYGGTGVEDFKNSYGNTIEEQIQGMSDHQLKVDKLQTDYRNSGVTYDVEFSWGNDPQEALKETEIRVRALTGTFPKEIRDSLSIYSYSDNAGFFAASFYSDTRSLDEVYKELEPKLTPKLALVGDAKEALLWNPQHKKVVVELDPVRMASLQIFPKQIENAIRERTAGFTAGSLQVGAQTLPIEVRKPNATVEDLSFLHIDSPTGKNLFLGDIAHIDYKVEADRGRTRKTNGAPSLILYASPRPGGNVKQMSEDILNIVAQLKPQFSKDIHYRVLVDPSEFIRGAIENVFHEVLIGSMLAVAILFLFIGSLKNVITAAIEIPLSMVLAFILMRMTGMNLNLISLGGLALASGMNVDASVVVMENIFRHLEHDREPKDLKEKLELIIRAVKEVRLSVIASTIASLVVFAPLAFTSALSYAVLGDLAKTVIFSHGFSAFVALILVPTVRLHLISKSKEVKKEVGHSPIEPQLQRLERKYSHWLGIFIRSKKKQLILVSTSFAALVLLLCFALPKLPKEVLGKPDTDWIMLGMNTQGNTILKQMETQTEEVESRLLQKLGGDIQYTFTQVNGNNNSTVMVRLKDKRQMKAVWKKLEEEFKDQASIRFWVDPWNPAELPLPNPPDLRVVVEGGHPESRRNAADSLKDALLEKNVLPKIWTEPSSDKVNAIVLRPYSQLQSSVNSADLADLIRVATEGKTVHYMSVDQTYTDIKLSFPRNTMTTSEDLQSFPIGVEGKIVPLRALSDVKIEPQSSLIHRENGRDLYAVIGKLASSADKTSDHPHLDQAKNVLDEWKRTHPLEPSLSVSMEDPQIEINDAIRQLTVAIGLSIVMIFFTLMFQMGSFTNSMIVLTAVPLGFIGVLLSLFIFQSTLSLNSVLGVILLNGIAVGNSIILVDFAETLFQRGLNARDAIVEAAGKRLRPILITSLTTILGMLPVALGFGQGGRVLQPLGIAVSGGLWVSMSITLFLVPALQYRVLKAREEKRDSSHGRPLAGLLAKVSRKEPFVLEQVFPPSNEHRPYYPHPEVTQ